MQGDNKIASAGFPDRGSDKPFKVNWNGKFITFSNNRQKAQIYLDHASLGCGYYNYGQKNEDVIDIGEKLPIELQVYSYFAYKKYAEVPLRHLTWRWLGRRGPWCSRHSAFAEINKDEKDMATIYESNLSAILGGNSNLRLVEPNIYSVLQDNETGNEYDTRFGHIYDWVACNPIYNRLIWGYSVNIFPQIAKDALNSTTEGMVLDIGCGSLAFTTDIYSKYSERPVVLIDQSLKMLRIAKSRLVKKMARFLTIWFFFTATLFDSHFKM